MCARFTLFVPGRALRENFDLVEEPVLTPRYNIAPSQSVIAVGGRADGATRGAALFQWGLIPHWAAEPNGPRPVNAKAETIAEKPMFRDSFRKRRCVIPASGYYEWRTEGKRKVPLYIRRRDGGLISFAGIWDCWKGGAEKLLTCTIVSTSAKTLTASIHERMPVILPSESISAWLDRRTESAEELAEMLKPCPAELLEIVPANPVVNSSRHEGPDCLTVG